MVMKTRPFPTRSRVGLESRLIVEKFVKQLLWSKGQEYYCQYWKIKLKTSWKIKQNSGSSKVAIKVHCKYCTGVLRVVDCAEGTVVCSLHCARNGWAMPSIKWLHWPAFNMPGRSTVCCLLCKGHCVSLHCAHKRHCVILHCAHKRHCVMLHCARRGHWLFIGHAGHSVVMPACKGQV